MKYKEIKTQISNLEKELELEIQKELRIIFNDFLLFDSNIIEEFKNKPSSISWIEGKFFQYIYAHKDKYEEHIRFTGEKADFWLFDQILIDSTYSDWRESITSNKPINFSSFYRPKYIETLTVSFFEGEMIYSMFSTDLFPELHSLAVLVPNLELVTSNEVDGTSYLYKKTNNQKAVWLNSGWYFIDKDFDDFIGLNPEERYQKIVNR